MKKNMKNIKFKANSKEEGIQFQRHAFLVYDLTWATGDQKVMPQYGPYFCVINNELRWSDEQKAYDSLKTIKEITLDEWTKPDGSLTTIIEPDNPVMTVDKSPPIHIIIKDQKAHLVKILGSEGGDSYVELTNGDREFVKDHEVYELK